MTVPHPDSAAPDWGNGRDAPPRGVARWKLVGPGIVVAATGVGAGDLVATLVAGARFGYATRRRATQPGSRDSGLRSAAVRVRAKDGKVVR